MKINKIYIAAFGKFKDYTIDFKDGLNVIYGENENGKTTLMAFIKMMFYGSGRNAAQLSRNPRLKYSPWSGEKMAGRIFFEHGGTNYCLEREFLKSDNTDKVRLINTDLGTTEIVPSNIGNRFFSIGSAAFERTVFIGSTGAFSTDEDANGEINSKLSNIALTGDEDTSYQIVLNRINDAKLKLMSKSGKAGKYDKGKLQLVELNNVLSVAKENESRKSALNNRLEEIKTESLKLSQEYAAVKQIVDSENDIRNRKKLEDYLSLKAELDELNAKTRLKNGDVFDETFVKKIEFCISKAELELQKINEYKNEISKIEDSITLAENSDTDELTNRKSILEAELSATKATASALQENIYAKSAQLEAAQNENHDVALKKKPFSPILLVAALLGLSLTALFFLLKFPTLAIVSAVLSALCLGLCFVVRPADKKALKNAEQSLFNLRNELAALKEREAQTNKEAYEISEELNRILTVINSDRAVVEHRKIALDELILKLTAAESNYTAVCTELLSVFGEYRPASSADEVKAALPELQANAEKLKQLKLKLKYVSDDLGGISYETAAEKLAALRADTANISEDFETKKSELQALNEKITTLKTEFSSITTELKTAFKNSPDSQSIQKEIDQLNKVLDSQKYFCELADIAATVLEKSFAEIRRSYGSALEKKALEIFSQLTDNAYGNLNISKSLDITVEKANDFGTKALEFLSNGTVDQAYLSLRLALCELIKGDENLPVFLDDVLCQYDDKRAETALKFLKEFSTDNQAILFTCHNSICDLAKAENITVQEM